MVVISTGASFFQLNASKLRRPLDTVYLEELRVSGQEHLCCGFLAKVK